MCLTCRPAVGMTGHARCKRRSHAISSRIGQTRLFRCDPPHRRRQDGLGTDGLGAGEPSDRARFRRGRAGRGAARRRGRTRPDCGARREHHRCRPPPRGHGRHRRLAKSGSAIMEAPPLHLALVGTPNSGKTSLFNALTGSRQKVANYPGVTVERKEGFFVTPKGRQVSLVDLPGTYSLRGRSPDEEITRDMVLGRTPGEVLPDLVLCVADSTNLRLTIRLVLELKATGRPLALVLNMFDIATRRGVTVDVA